MFNLTEQHGLIGTSQLYSTELGRFEACLRLTKNFFKYMHDICQLQFLFILTLAPNEC